MEIKRLIKHRCKCHVCGKYHEYVNLESWISPLGASEDGIQYVACSDGNHSPNDIRKAYNKISGNNWPELVEYKGIWLEPKQIEYLKNLN